MLEGVAATAGVSLGEVSRSCFGLAGVSSAAVRAWAAKAMGQIAGGELIVCGDEEIALEAAFARGSGHSGGRGYGIERHWTLGERRSVRRGGWGPVLGDEGSGTWIGLEAIRAALRAQGRIGLGGVSTCLLREIERHWEVGSLSELVALANRRGDGGGPAPDFATLAPVVAALRGAGRLTGSRRPGTGGRRAGWAGRAGLPQDDGGRRRNGSRDRRGVYGQRALRDCRGASGDGREVGGVTAGGAGAGAGCRSAERGAVAGAAGRGCGQSNNRSGAIAAFPRTPPSGRPGAMPESP